MHVYRVQAVSRAQSVHRSVTYSSADGSSDSAHDGAAVSRAGSRQVHFMSIWAEWAALQSAKAYKLRRHHTRRVQLDLTEPGQVVQDLGTNRRHCTSEPIVVVRVVSALLSTRAHKVGITFRVFPDGELSGQFQTLTDVETGMFFVVRTLNIVFNVVLDLSSFML